MPESPANSRDDVLRKVGRNIVNFQKVEHALKRLIPLSSTTVSSSDVSRNLSKQVKSLKRTAFGEVVKRFDNALYGEAVVPEPTSSADGARLSISFKIQLKAEAEAQRRKLVALVRERNRLIHHDLFEFDFSSETECQQLSARLDAQNDRILEQLAFIRSVRDSHVAALADFAAFLESNEFRELLASDDGNA